MCLLSITHHATCSHLTIKPLITCRPLCLEPSSTEGPRRDLCAKCLKQKDKYIGQDRQEKVAAQMAAAGVGAEADHAEDVWVEIEL